MQRFLSIFKTVFLFALPIITGQVGHMLFGVGDTILVGHYSTAALSALGISIAITYPFLAFGLGITDVISSMKARVLAEEGDATSFITTSLTLTTVMGILFGSCVALVASQVHHLNFSSEVSALVKKYLFITSFSVVPALWFQALKENLQAYEKTVFANGTIIVFNGVNLLLNYLLIFTLDLGVVGAALATTISRYGMACTLALHGRKHLHFSGTLSRELMVKIVGRGVPAGLGTVATASVFSAVTIIAGTFGVIASAANNIIITISSVTYMIPYAIAGAVSVKVGQSMGRREYGDVRRYALAGTVLGLLFACVAAGLFLLFPKGVLAFASSDQRVLAYGIPLLFTVALYQLPDAIQMILLGVLRGMGITLRPFFLTILGVWIVGFPAGLFFAYRVGLEVQGMWIGLALGLLANALLLGGLFVRRSTVQQLLVAHRSNHLGQ